MAKKLVSAILASPNHVGHTAQQLKQEAGRDEAKRIASEMQRNTPFQKLLAAIANAVHASRGINVPGDVSTHDIAHAGKRLDDTIDYY